MRSRKKMKNKMKQMKLNCISNEYHNHIEGRRRKEGKKGKEAREGKKGNFLKMVSLSWSA